MTRRAAERLEAAGLAGRILGFGFRAIVATWRVSGASTIHREIERLEGKPLLVGFWHGKYIPLFGILRGVPAHVFAAAGFRGRLIESICQAFGFTPVLLPTGKRAQAIEQMRTALKGPLPCASAFDGALGPNRRVKPALVRIASDVGATILPISAAARQRCVLGWRWDRREIPLPFASVALRVGAPINVPTGLSDRDLDAWCEQIKSALDELDDEDAGARIHQRPRDRKKQYSHLR